MKKTKAGGHDAETQRLAANHEVFIRGLGGKLTVTPLDLTKPGLKILDSACADGKVEHQRYFEITQANDTSRDMATRSCGA